MTSMRTFVATAIMAISAAAWVPAGAVVVWDPGNFVVNASTATTGLLTEASAAVTAIQNIKQTIELVRQTMSTDGVSRLAGLQDELRLYQELNTVNTGLTRSISSSSDLYQNMAAQYGASNFSWENFVKGRATLQSNQAQSLLDKYDSVTRSIASQNGRREEILRQVQGAESNKAATQALSAQIDILIAQNQQTMSLLATQIAAQGAQQKSKAGDDDAARKAMELQERRYRDAARSFR